MVIFKLDLESCRQRFRAPFKTMLFDMERWLETASVKRKLEILAGEQPELLDRRKRAAILVFWEWALVVLAREPNRTRHIAYLWIGCGELYFSSTNFYIRPEQLPPGPVNEANKLLFSPEGTKPWKYWSSQALSRS